MALNLDVFQQCYQLGMVSNIVRGCQGSPQELQDKLAEALPAVIEKHVGPGWEICWGPAVWKHDGATDEMPPDNVWYVAKNPAIEFEDGSVSCAYVVAIAATAGDDFKSYDWIHENFGVGSVVDFRKWILEKGITTRPTTSIPIIGFPKAFTANGTTNAVYTLANCPPVGGTQSLCDFLKSVDAPAGSRVVFTGQSLGGALSPTLASAMKLAGCVDKFGDNALVYPSAGASPGNGKFAELFRELFPVRGDTSSYRVWNLNFVNMSDPVPNAWCVNPASELRLGRIPTLYGEPPKKLLDLLNIGVGLMRSKAVLSGVVYVPLDRKIVPGMPVEKVPESLADFIGEFAKQHMAAYHTFVLGPAFFTLLPPVLCPTTPEREVALSTPVLGCLEEAMKGNVPEQDGEEAPIPEE